MLTASGSTVTPDWLTFFSTVILGLVTVYFAWRSRQLKLRQVRQINREFDRKLSEAEAEIEKGRLLPHLWQENWKTTGDVLQAFELYARTRNDVARPDLPKLTKTLAFHLPNVEPLTSDAVIKFYATLQFLDLLITQRPTLTEIQLREQVSSAEAMLVSAKQQLDKSRDAVRTARAKLRDY